MDKRDGKLYAPIPHPDFESWPSRKGSERFEIIEPHLEYQGGTALDIGAHFGVFADWLEDLGYTVTAVEKSSEHAQIAREVRDLCGKRFAVVEGSIFELDHPRFDVVLALNIIHHLLKTRETFEQLELFLDRLECKMMILQIAKNMQNQTADSYRTMEEGEFVRFVAERSGLTEVQFIGSEGGRKVFKLTPPA